MKFRIDSEAERIATALGYAHGTLKEYMMMQRALPDAIFDIAMSQPSVMSKTEVAACMLVVVQLYDRCIKSGAVDESAVDGAFLSIMRKAIESAKENGVPEANISTPEEAHKEMRKLFSTVINRLDEYAPKLNVDAASIIAKARKP